MCLKIFTLAKKKLLQNIQTTNDLEALVSARKGNGSAAAVRTQENAIKKAFDKRFGVLSDFDFLKNPVYPYGLKEDLIVRLEPNPSEKVILATGETSATCKVLDVLLEYNAVFGEPYATALGEMYTGATSILYTKVTSIHYQTLSKKDTTWNIDVNNLFFYCRAYCYYLSIKGMTMPTRTSNSIIQASKKYWSRLTVCLINFSYLVYKLEISIQN